MALSTSFNTVTGKVATQIGHRNLKKRSVAPAVLKTERNTAAGKEITTKNDMPDKEQPPHFKAGELTSIFQ